ncbi:hypothetical protein ACLMJK_001376 [Lecanora helva]
MLPKSIQGKTGDDYAWSDPLKIPRKGVVPRNAAKDVAVLFSKASPCGNCKGQPWSITDFVKVLKVRYPILSDLVVIDCYYILARTQQPVMKAYFYPDTPEQQEERFEELQDTLPKVPVSLSLQKWYDDIDEIH